MKLLGNKWFTYWVPYESKVKAYAIPNPKWDQFEVIKVWGKKDTYTEADEAVSGIDSHDQEEVIVSDYGNYSDDADKLPEKRLSVKKRVYSSASDSEGQQEKFKNKPKKFVKKKSYHGKPDGNTAGNFLQSLPHPPRDSEVSLSSSEEARTPSTKAMSLKRSSEEARAPSTEGTSLKRSSEELVTPSTKETYPKTSRQEGATLSTEGMTPKRSSQVTPSRNTKNRTNQETPRQANAAGSKNQGTPIRKLTATTSTNQDETECGLNALNADTNALMQDQDIECSENITTLTELVKEVYTEMKEIKLMVRGVEEEMQKIKASLMATVPEENQEDLFRMQQYNEREEFEAFCERLDEDGFRRLVVRYMIGTYGSQNIGGVVRGIMRASMTDALMQQYNRTGQRGKAEFPKTFEKCIYYAAKHFQKHKEVKMKKKNMEVVTTVKEVVQDKVEKFLSNAGTRQKN